MWILNYWFRIGTVIRTLWYLYSTLNDFRTTYIRFALEPGTTSRCTATGPLRHAALPDNYWLQNNKAFPLIKCIRRYVYNGLFNHCGLGLTKSIHWWRICSLKNNSDLWPFRFKFAPLVTRIANRYVSTELEVYRYMAFLFRENRRHGMDRRTDTGGVQHLMRTPKEGRVITMSIIMK